MLKQLLSVFLESQCPFCDRTSGDPICQYCQKKLLSHRLFNGDRLYLWQNQSVFAWGKYDGQLKRAIALMKYDNHPEIGSVLGKLLAQAWLASVPKLKKVTVVPIPMYRSKLKSRGFNQAEIIARSFCRLTGYRLNSQALIRTRQTKAMFALNPEERKQNLQGAFKLGRLPKHPVLLIDDIYTTGTTAKESIRVLQQHQIETIGVATAAKTSKQVKDNENHSNPGNIG